MEHIFVLLHLVFRAHCELGRLLVIRHHEPIAEGRDSEELLEHCDHIANAPEVANPKVPGALPHIVPWDVRPGGPKRNSLGKRQEAI